MMWYDEDGPAWCADESETFTGWEVLCREPWKAGVEKVTIRRVNGTDAELRIVFQGVANAGREGAGNP